nr:hypothetical protein [Halomonas sp. UBA3074]
MAIWADFANPSYAESAAAEQANIYITSALVTETGYAADARLLSAMAKRHQFPVLLANHLSNTGGWQTAGKSGGWNTSGELAIVADEGVPSLVLVDVSQYKLKATKATFSFRYPTLSDEANLPNSK